MITQKQAYLLGQHDRHSIPGDIPPVKHAVFTANKTEAHWLAYLDGYQGFAFKLRRADGQLRSRK